MRVNDSPRLPLDIPGLVRTLQYVFREFGSQLNGVSEGRISAVTNAYTAMPTAGEFNVGDFVKNSSPSELGSAGSKYVITGWVCTVSSPLTFLECRCLTGN